MAHCSCRGWNGHRLHILHPEFPENAKRPHSHKRTANVMDYFHRLPANDRQYVLRNSRHDVCSSSNCKKPKLISATRRKRSVVRYPISLRSIWNRCCASKEYFVSKQPHQLRDQKLNAEDCLTLTMIMKRRSILFFLSLVFFLNCCFLQSAWSQDGERLFKQNCASCHAIFKPLVGPPLANFETHGPWGDRGQLYDWIANPPAYMAKDQYTKGLQQQYGTMMQAFGSSLTHQDIDAIVDYINKAATVGPASPGAQAVSEPTAPDNWAIFGVISLIMGIIALVLLGINSNLKKLSDDKEGILRADPVPFYKNKIYLAFFSVVVFICVGYFITKAAIGTGRQRSYEPAQPIYFSHKVHAGINQINCLYCHGNAWESRVAAIPSLNVCLNCHKVIQGYEKGPRLFDPEGNEVNGTREIMKLYKYANFNPANAASWNASMVKPIEWIKIHNLPDHVFFSHAQHVRAGKIQCQTCHGPVTEMDEIKQFAELSMSWCINCHRTTHVDFDYNDSTGNKFYSIYERFHDDIKHHKMDSVTVKDIGGTECQKCHY